jgi:hypothetical protein
MPIVTGNSGLDYRPNTYFWAHDLKVELPSDIAGAERRRRVSAAPGLRRGRDRLHRHRLDHPRRHMRHVNSLLQFSM